jgi:GAG-pre-integrase domain
VKGGLYHVFASNSGVGAYSSHTRQVLSIDKLHRHLGHVSYERVKSLVKKGLVEGIELEPSGEVHICESCEWAKGERKIVTRVREGERHTAVGDEVHSDLWGPAPVESINHKQYYVSFTDDFSRYTQVYFLHTKDETFDSYRAFEAW